MIKKITFITIGLICFFRLSSEAQQNCYNNPSIEGTSQAHVVPSPWNTCWGSPDTQPGQWGITLPASNLNTYVSFLASNNYSYLEGMTQPLNTCMVAGQTYTFTVDLAHSNVYNTAGPGNCYSSFAVWGGNTSCSRTELLYCSGEIWNTTWQSYTITFTPSGNWCYIGFSPCYLTPCSGYINLLMDNISCINPVSGVVTTTDVTCFGACDGTASANPIGGTPPYAYSWSPGGQITSSISGLCQGTYTVTITDAANQITTADGIVVQPPALVLNTSKTDVSCLAGSDGSATVNASGGTGAYTYLWSPGGGTTQTAAGLTAGTYCVTVTDANGCQMPVCVTILDGGTVTANISASANVSCTGGNDGSATVTVTDGTPPYTFLWGNGQITAMVSLLTVGTHCVTVTDSKGCITNVCVTITEPTPLVAVINLTVDLNCNSICDGQATVAPAGGTPPYTYLWDNGQTLPTTTGLCAGTSGITVIDANGCTTTSSATINQPAPLALTTTKIDPGCMDSCDGSATVIVIGGTLPYTYEWQDNLGFPIGQTTSTANNLCNEAYIIQVTDNNGCIANTTVVLNDPPPFIAFIDTFINVDCNGTCSGYALVSASGGGVPYTYLWSNGDTTDQATNLCPNTYSVTVTNTNGCRFLASMVITEPPLLTDTISSIDVTCFGACDGAATVTVLGGVPPYTYQWDAGTGFQTTPTAANLCSDPAGITYTVMVTDANGCTLTDNVIITQPLELGLIQSIVSPTTCSSNNGSACVIASGGVFPYTYLWNDSNATDSTCITNVFAGMYNPTVTDAMGCQFTVPVLINDIAGPTIDSISTNALNCYGDVTGIAEIFFSGGTPSFSYIWNTDAGDTIAMGSTIVFLMAGGSYSVTIIDNNMCVESDTFSIYEPPQLNSGISPSNDVICKDSCDGDATVNVSGGTPPYAYLWSPTGQTTPTATGLCMGVHNVTITDAMGCTTASSDSINEPPALIVTTAVTPASCFGFCDGVACVTPSGGTPPYTYLWISGGQTTTCIASLCDGTYVVEVTDANGCLVLENIVVSEPQQLIATGGSTPSTCGNANGMATVSPQGGTLPYYFLWDDPNFQTNDTATGLLAGSYNVDVTDYNGCTLTFPVTVTDVAGPVINSITVIGVDCNGSTNGSATVWISGGTLPYIYLWDDGQTATTVDTTHTAIGLPAGPISVTITDLNGCTVTGNDTVAEPGPLTVSVTGGGTICYGQSATISVSSTTGGTTPYSYTWDNGLPDLTSHVVSPLTTTSYTVTVTDTNGCSLSQTVTVTVNPPLTVSAADVTICEGDDAILGAGASGGSGVYTFTWDNSFVGDTQTVSGLTIDGTIFRVILSDGCSLEDTAYVTVLINSLPTVSFSSVCVDPPIPSVIQFNAVVSGGVPPYTYDWDFDDGSIGTGDTTTHLYSGGSGLYNVSLTVTTVQGCSGNYSLIIQGPPAAVFIVTPPEKTSILNPVFVFDDTTFNALTNVVVWEWDFDDGDTLVGFDSAGANPTHTYSDTGTYDVLLTVYNSDGCKDTAWRTVRVISEYVLFVPSAFFPESYVRKNQYFRPVGIGIDNGEFEIFIYDRWGNKIYEYDGRYDTWLGWDGRANGGKKIAQIDVYVWLIILKDLHGDSHQHIGHVTLLK